MEHSDGLLFDENQLNQQQGQFLHWYTDEKNESQWTLNASRMQRLLKAKAEIQKRSLRPKPTLKHYGGTAN